MPPIVTRSNVPIESDNAFKIECVTVCNKFHDFLARTIPTNKHLFDKTVVVTAPEDDETKRLCEHYNCMCLKTDALRSRWGEFCKGAAINEGLAELSKDGWVVHMDADIYLPPLTRELIRTADLDREMIYGIDRFDMKGYEMWDTFLSMPSLQHEAGTYIHVNKYPLGTRVMFSHSSGWVPLGYFQMWHPKVSGITAYPATHNTAGRSDTLFSQQWPRNMRALIPEIIAYHLMSSEEGKMGQNWEGRTSSSFAHLSSASKKLP